MRLLAALWLAVIVLPPALASETNGQLNIVSQPGVEVVWEGVSLGSTDEAGLLVIEGIPPGSYDLLLRKPGYRNRTSRVEVDSSAQSVRMQLRRRPAPRKQESKPVQEEPRPEPEPVVRMDASAALTDPPASLEVDPAAPSAPPVQAAKTTAMESRTAETQPQSNALPPALYLLGLALIGTTGALAHQWRRRARARAAFLAGATPVAFEPPRNSEAESPSFLGDIKRREVAMEDLVDAGLKRRWPDAVDVEVVDLGPVEEDD